MPLNGFLGRKHVFKRILIPVRDFFFKFNVLLFYYKTYFQVEERNDFKIQMLVFPVSTILSIIYFLFLLAS